MENFKELAKLETAYGKLVKARVNRTEAINSNVEYQTAKLLLNKLQEDFDKNPCKKTATPLAAQRNIVKQMWLSI